MDATFTDFREAHLKCSGPLLSTTIIPSAPPDDPNRLRRFFNASSNSTVQTDIRTGLLAHSNTTVRFSKLEGNAWVDVYVAYWRAIGELLLIEDGILSNWSTIYEAWKEVTNTLIRGYSSANFESWTIPCLYVTGRYLRAFAIKADDNSRAKRGSMFPAGMQEDIAGGVGKNENLEDAARIINRIFTLCVSDRYVVLSIHQEISALSASLRLLHQGTTRRVQEMGPLLYNKSSFQDLLQGYKLRTNTMHSILTICSSIPSASPRIFFAPYKHLRTTCLQ